MAELGERYFSNISPLVHIEDEHQYLQIVPGVREEEWTMMVCQSKDDLFQPSVRINVRIQNE